MLNYGKWSAMFLIGCIFVATFSACDSQLTEASSNNNTAVKKKPAPPAKHINLQLQSDASNYYSLIKSDLNKFVGLRQQYRHFTAESNAGNYTNETSNNELENLYIELSPILANVEFVSAPDDMASENQLLVQTLTDFENGLQAIQDGTIMNNNSDISKGNHFMDQSTIEFKKFVTVLQHDIQQ